MKNVKFIKLIISTKKSVIIINMQMVMKSLWDYNNKFIYDR